MRPVFLIGYMGCGKTTLGEELARQMQLRYIDLDDFIEAKCGMSIVEIFDEMGENRFRELETAALLEVATMTGVIIGCGGGTPCHGDNMSLMKRHPRSGGAGTGPAQSLLFSSPIAVRLHRHRDPSRHRPHRAPPRRSAAVIPVHVLEMADMLPVCRFGSVFARMEKKQ